MSNHVSVTCGVQAVRNAALLDLRVIMSNRGAAAAFLASLLR